jgi:hypothetical protein
MISAISELALASNAKELTSAEFNAKAHADEIASVFEAHQFCAEEGEGRHLSPEAKAVLKYHEYDGTNHTEVAEAIEVSCQETALSVDVRSGWGTPGELEPEEFQILLSTGGPALRIIGDLQSNEPSCARLEFQDWGTPWTQWRRDVDHEALDWFCSLFYFGA